MEEHHSEHKKTKKISVWKIITVVLAALLIISIFTSGFSSFTKGVSKKQAEEKVLNFLKGGILSQATVFITNIEDTNGLYKLTLDVNGQEYPSYLTKDAKLLFPIGAIDITQKPDSTQTPQEPSQEIEKVDVSLDDDPMKGDENAPVTIVEFSDFQCPFCGKVEPTVKQILDIYKGKVKLVYRDFPLNSHEFAQKAAEASECADEQDKFWEYHDKLFENQDALTIEDLKKYASGLELDTVKFNDCLDSGKYESEVQKDFEDGQKYGVSGTPAFFINGKLISGNQPFSVFQQIIEGELAA